MRRRRQKIDQAMLLIYAGIMEFYAPYVLVRCANCTNRRLQAELIGVYALICTCLATREVPWTGDLSRLIDVMVDVVRRDVVGHGKGVQWWGPSEDLLLVQEPARRMAQALNRLPQPLRAVLVLRRVTGLEPPELARLLDEPAGAVAARLGRAERALAQRLGVPDARGLLTRFTAGLDNDWVQEVTACAMAFLAEQARPARSRPPCRDRN